MSEIDITDARARLASVVDDARREPVYLTRRNRIVAAIVDADMRRSPTSSVGEPGCGGCMGQGC